MRAADPIYAGLRRRMLPEGVSEVRVDVGDASVASPEVLLSREVEVAHSDVLAGNLEQFHDVVQQVAETHLEQFMRPFFEHVGEAAAAVGNTMDLDGASLTWDALLDAAEVPEWAVDAAGQVHAPTMVAGDAVLARLRALPPMTPEQQERAALQVMRKQEEHVSRRRGRRLR